MNCERFQTVASDLARQEMLEASDRNGALAHIDECGRCAQLWSEQSELSEGLRSLALQMRSIDAPVQLEEKLRLAFRDRTHVHAAPAAAQRWGYWASAIAAALLIAFGVMAWRAYSASPNAPTNEATANGRPSTVQSPKPDDYSLVAGTIGNQTDDDSMKPKRSPANHDSPTSQRFRHGTAAANAPTSVAANDSAANSEAKEVTTDFVALGYASTMDLQDGGQLLRVELPRSSLARFGLPMNMDRADERVKADVLVGTDGLARAIRFVK